MSWIIAVAIASWFERSHFHWQCCMSQIIKVDSYAKREKWKKSMVLAVLHVRFQNSHYNIPFLQMILLRVTIHSCWVLEQMAWHFFQQLKMPDECDWMPFCWSCCMIHFTTVGKPWWLWQNSFFLTVFLSYFLTDGSDKRVLYWLSTMLLVKGVAIVLYLWHMLQIMLQIMSQIIKVDRYKNKK